MKGILNVKINTPTKKTWVYVLRMVLCALSIPLVLGFGLAWDDIGLIISFIPAFFIFKSLIRNYNLYLQTLLSDNNNEEDENTPSGGQ